MNTEIFTRTSPIRRSSILWILLAILITCTNSSWISWFWTPEVAPTVNPCIVPISHVYSANETMAAWKAYLIKERISLDAMADKAVGSFIMFLTATYTPCLKEEFEKLWPTESSWKDHFKRVIISDAFLCSLPGTLAMIIIVIKCLKNQCQQKGTYRLLKKNAPHLMK